MYLTICVRKIATGRTDRRTDGRVATHNADP